MVLSINSRMLITAGVVLVSFLGLTGTTLETSFRTNAEEALKERLRVHLTAVIASAEATADGRLNLVYALPETRFFTEGSGLYAKILGNTGQIVWSSPSLKGISIPVQGGLRRGESRYEHLNASDGTPLLLYALGVTWGENQKFKEGYTFIVAESLDRFNQQMFEFRQNLWGWLGGLTIVLPMMLAIILRWGLAPLRRVAEDLSEIEDGRHLELIGKYPSELRGLTDNLNALIRTNREHELRYQASLGDLAHSLKTPLAVLRGAVVSPQQDESTLRHSIEEQVERMDQIVQYQLQRAATSGRTVLLAPVDINQVTQKVVKALAKVYAEKGVKCQLNVVAGLVAHCEEGDLMELLGNLIDNAFKWCASLVRVNICKQVSDDDQEASLLIEVMDDGKGIDEAHIETVLARGGRVDDQTGGHGLGLAMVRDVVDLYKGRLEIGRGSLGGAEIRVWLPL